MFFFKYEMKTNSAYFGGWVNVQAPQQCQVLTDRQMAALVPDEMVQ